MTTTETTETPRNRAGKPRQNTDNPEAISLLDDLRALSEREARVEAELDSILTRRNTMFLKLVRLGVTHREISEHTNVGPPAVKKAIDRLTRRTR